MSGLVDAHVHLDAFGEAWPAALAEIRAHRIVTLAVSMDVASWEVTKALAAGEPLLVPAFGIHPWEAPSGHTGSRRWIPWWPRRPCSERWGWTAAS